MYICPNCNKQYEEPTNFCSNCGAAMTIASEPKVEEPKVEIPVVEAPEIPATEAPTTEAPVIEAPKPPVAAEPTYQPPFYQQPPQYAVQVNPPSKAKAITGMALSAAGLAFAFMGFLYTLIFMMVDGAAGLGMSIGFGIFSLPLSLVGLIISGNNRNAGDRTVFSKIGKILGIVGVILSGVSFLIGFAGLDFDGIDTY